MNADYVKAFVERCYENDEIDYFAVAADDLTSKDRKNLMEKALQEGNVTYYDILKNKEDWGYSAWLLSQYSSFKSSGSLSTTTAKFAISSFSNARFAKSSTSSGGR